ncbi:MAG: hypothetical protein D3922_07775 [Candidatus Electrothrix sp. AR1]|nr:hypothetical protein [Candidatus Electrothrix sp. AR1]
MILLPAKAVFAEGSGQHTILRVEVEDSGFNIYTANGDFNPATCADQAVSTVNKVISFKLSNFPYGYGHMLSTALAAHMGGRKISMWYAWCQESPCKNGQMPKPQTLVIQ